MPQNLRGSAEVYQRVRVLLGILLIFWCTTLPFVIIAMITRGPLDVTTLLSLVGLAFHSGNCYLLWRTGRYRLCGALTITVTLLLLNGSALRSGEVMRLMMWSALLPIIGTHLLGRAAGLVTALVCATNVIVLEAAKYAGHVPDAPHSSLGINPALHDALFLVLFIMVCALMAWIYETSRARATATRDRAEAELIATREDALAASRVKSQFLANMSHEIRTPLNGVLGMLGLLQDTGLTREQREYAEVALRSGRSLLYILNDILDLARVESGRLELEPVPFDLRSVIEDLVEETAVAAQAKGIEVVARYLSDVPSRFVGDAGRIRQVLVNLLGNAIKFTERGHVLIAVESGGQGDGTATLKIAIEDTGPGIPASARDVIFEKFQQADASITRLHGGTGLGLAITRELVTLMGGDIDFTTEEGHGTTFWFTLTLSVDERESVAALPPPGLRGARTLIVDDHPVNRQVLEEQLRRWGIPCAACGSGAEALHLLTAARDRGEPYELAVIDYQMPEMDGLTLGRAIKSDPALAATALVLFSSMGAHPGAASDGVYAAYVNKPIRQSRLMDALQTAWASRRSSAARTREPLPPVQRSALATRAARILVVEDNSVNQKVARHMLEREGCRVDVAANGREALTLTDEFTYDLVFMDVQMPVLDGLQATAAIREREEGCDRLPIVAMTAHAMTGDRERCLAAGMDGYMAKPIRPRDLTRVLAEFLR